MEKTKAQYLAELKGLLAEWNTLLTKQAALDTDVAEYTKLSSEIKSVCDALDAIERSERVS